MILIDPELPLTLKTLILHPVDVVVMCPIAVFTRPNVMRSDICRKVGEEHRILEEYFYRRNRCFGSSDRKDGVSKRVTKEVGRMTYAESGKM